jgi:hypothetical protein
LEGAPRIEDFRLQWDATPFQSRHELTLSMTGEAFAWSAGLGTPQTPATPLPWVFDAAPDRRWFDDEEGHDDNSDRRKRAYVTSARLTIAGWKNGIASGRLQFQTTRGVAFDTAFDARIEDRDGVLERASRLSESSSKPGGVDVQAAALGGSPRVVRVTITNCSEASIYVLKDPSLPGIDVDRSGRLTLHFDVEDFPEGTDANVNIFPQPNLEEIGPTRSVTRQLEIPSRVKLSNWLGIHWDLTERPPRHLREPPTVDLRFPLEVKAVVGYGHSRFVYTAQTVPQDARLAFLQWQRRAASPAIAVE